MSVLDSVFVGLFGMAVVFVVLVGLSLLLRLQAALIGGGARKKTAKASPEKATLGESAEPAAPEPLRLIGVDEKTAALVMAIVCDEMNAQPEELQFKSIRALERDNGEAREQQ